MFAILTIVAYLGGAVALLLVTVFLSFTAYIYYIHWKYSHIPQPKRSSFYLGHLLDVIQAQKEANNYELSPVVFVKLWLQKVDSPIFVTFTLHIATVFVLDPESIKTIMMKSKINKHERFTDRFGNVMGERFLGNSLVSIPDYETWKPRRQQYDSSFRKNYLRTLLNSFNETVDRFLEEMKPQADGETTVPMKHKFEELALNVISKAAFGMEPTNVWSDESLGLKRVKGDGTLSFLTKHAFKGLGKHIIFPYYQYFHPFEAEEYREVTRALRRIGRDFVTKRIQIVKSGQQVPNDILTQILQMASTNEGMNIEELVDDFLTFYVAGQETTGSLLAFALVLTLQHPNVLERLESEVTEVLGDRTYVTSEDLEKLQYTEQILKETLRLYGAVFATIKRSPPDGITLNGYHIPAGTQIVLSSSVLCREPKYFDDPDTFNPSRFDPENKQPNTFVYFPFGVGHRACIGKHFAMMEAKLAFSRLFQMYKITLPENYELVPVMRFTIQVKDDIDCTLQLKK